MTADTGAVSQKLSTGIRLRLSLMMFLQFFVWGAWFVTMGTFLGEGLSATGSQISLAYLTQSLGAILAPLIIGLIADQFFSAQKILGVLHIAGAVLLWIAGDASQFSLFFPLILGYMILYMPTLALVNSVSFRQMRDPERQFPAVRVLGTIGWIVAGLIIGWLGFGAESKIALAVAICFFPVWIDTMIGLSLPSADEFKLMAALRASRRQTFVKLQLPSAIPMIMVGVKHALLLAFTGVLVAEILAASAGGLGTLVKEFSLQLNMPLTVAVVLVVVLIAVALVSVMDYVERKVVFWSEAARARNS